MRWVQNKKYSEKEWLTYSFVLCCFFSQSNLKKKLDAHM